MSCGIGAQVDPENEIKNEVLDIWIFVHFILITNHQIPAVVNSVYFYNILQCVI